MAQNTTISIAYKIEGVSGGFKKLTVDAEAFRKLMEANVIEAKNLKKSFMDFSVISNGLANVGRSVNELVNAFSQITGENIDFDKAMKAANTMAGKDSAGFRKMKDEVAELAKQLPIARNELANGLYQVISNGVPEGNWLEYLRTSARSAVGGIADINKVVGVTSTVIKNYGMEWDAAADIQDKIQLTAKNGVTSFEQLAQALPRVTGNAASLGVSIDELLGTFATLTGVSGNTAEVSTQLAAIFTALVKPSSEATKMAAQMGIQFDAASIKAAGGFRSFLQELEKSIHAYAEANGVLEQEVYGKLFGSAESLRALVPLQGELADKFAENVDSMANSAGTMDAAFADMSSTGEAVIQMLKNKLAAITDVVAGVAGAAQPYLTFTAALLTTASNAMILIGAMKQLHVTQHLVATRTKLLSGLLFALGHKGKSTGVLIRVFSGAMTSGAYSATALKIALKGLLISTGVGVAIFAVTSIIEYFAGAADKATDSVEKLDDASDEYVRAAADAKVQIDKDVKSLEELINANKTSAETIGELNERYGELFGSHQTLKEWYNTLRVQSQVYIKQMGYEAQARSLLAKITEASVNKELAAERKAELERSGKHKTPQPVTTGGGSGAHSQPYMADTDEYKKACQELQKQEEIESELQKRYDVISKKQEEISEEIKKGQSNNGPKQIQVGEMTWQQAKDALDKAETDLKNANPNDSKTLKRLKAYYDKVKARKEALDKQYGFGNVGKSTSNKKAEIADPKTSEELSTNIEIYKKKLTDEDSEEQRIYREKISRWEKAKESIDMMQKQAERPASLSSLEEIDKEISFQRSLRQKANKENIAGIDSEIKRLEDLRDELELSAHTPVPVEEIKTYKQLNAELSYYNALLDKADQTQHASIHEQINQLNDLKKAWDRQLEELKKPGDISTLDTIAKLDEAISYYQARQKDASEDEVQEIQKTINAYERKRSAMQRGIEIPSMVREADEINKLTGKEYKLKIRGMGFDELTEKIRELQKMLNDTENPVTESQRKDIEGLIGVYEKWRREGISTFDTYRSGWDGLKGMGGGIESLTNTIQGNGNAWQKATGIVDGFLQIYDGIKTVVGIIDMLSVASGAHTAAKTAEAVAVGAVAGAQSAEAIAAETSAAAQIPVIAANKMATASYMELASAAYFAAHASIPFAGFGIASGFVAAATSMVEAIGVMPFADGGIVSGPTLGLVGEYAGAKSNPEVIAPLNRLKDLIGNDENGANGRVEFEIRGDRLFGLLRKYERNKNRT